jgi:phosphatidylinositol alpha 1,6-mannosyltransferase
VAVVTESFLPQVNGVTNSVLRILEYLRRNGHSAIVVANSDPAGVPDQYLGFPVVTVPSFALPMYKSVRLSTATTAPVERVLEQFSPDVVHLAGPIMLGYRGVSAAARLGVPSVAVYQTDLPSYVQRYGFGWSEGIIWAQIRRLHNMASLTLAPSTYTRDQLLEQGVARVALWGRGVDSQRFRPERRDQQLHDSWAPNHEIVIGYLGRLAGEKRVADLACLRDIPGSRLVIVGDGPQRSELAELLPDAVFTGAQTGSQTARHMASFDVFVHPGDLETFGQTLQEAHACGLPVIAPRKGGPIDLVTPGVDGWLYEPGDLYGLRSHVAELVANPEELAAFGAAGKARVAGRTWETLCNELMAHYNEAITMSRLISDDHLAVFSA